MKLWNVWFDNGEGTMSAILIQSTIKPIVENNKVLWIKGNENAFKIYFYYGEGGIYKIDEVMGAPNV